MPLMHLADTWVQLHGAFLLTRGLHPWCVQKTLWCRQKVGMHQGWVRRFLAGWVCGLANWSIHWRYHGPSYLRNSLPWICSSLLHIAHHIERILVRIAWVLYRCVYPSGPSTQVYHKLSTSAHKHGWGLRDVVTPTANWSEQLRRQSIHWLPLFM